MHNRACFLSFLAVIFLFASCNSFEKLLKSDDINYKLTRANTYYDKKQYQKAMTVYETLLPVMKGTKNFEQLYFRYAFSHYYLKDYLSASYHFKNFLNYFPTSKDEEEVEYLQAYCLYKMSPKASLEQTNTIKALDAMQAFINTHPNSKRITDANLMMDQMRKKLEEKESGAAKLYYHLGQYKASATAFKTVIQNYPESSNSDYYQLMILKSFFKYAQSSFKEKQEERYANAINAYNELKENYPNSRYLQDAEKYLTLANNSINKLRNEHQ